ncbi:ABC transporter G family member 20-like [Brevipalpus obovatus]|uniref:ABC transporter G family member 20-like n=1 Tax=Brevipalpus obovatus TaxID=246614 RepID=UPI003D9EAA9F
MSLIANIENLSFKYSKLGHEARILRNVSIQIRSSEILTIVGPSGCGKTTLIKLIISLLPVDHGRIFLYGYDCTNSSKNRKIVGVPGPNFGFMPQEDALTDDLTIRECLFMYGILNRMKLSRINERTREVLSELDLIGNERSYISDLSGGMKRRVSLAIAILHSPQLLILDEPTVGVDPILRHRIWQLLEKMRNDGAGIVITTHYIEECGLADMMCFMRNGQILKTEAPQRMRSSINFTSFEKVFLDLCSTKSSPLAIEIKEFEQQKISKPGLFAKPKPYNVNYWSRIQIIMVLMYRYFHLFISTPASLLCILATPTFNVYLNYIALSGHLQGVPIGICVENQSLYNDTALFTSQNIVPACLDCIHPNHFSEFINNQVFEVVKYSNIDVAIRDISRFKMYAAIHIREGFADAFLRKLVLDWSELEDQVIRDAKIVIHCDASNRHIMEAVEGYLFDAYGKFWEASKRNLSLKLSSINLMRFEDSVINGKKIQDHSSGPWLMMGSLVITVTSISVTIAGSAIIREVKDKSITRYMSTGLSSMEVFVAQLSSNTVFLGSCGMLALRSTLWLIGEDSRGSALVASLIIVLMIVNSVLVGQIIGLAQLSEIFVIILSLSLAFVTSNPEGAYISTESFPYYAQFFVSILPNTKAIRALKSLVLTGVSYTNPLVLQGIFMQFSYLILFFNVSHFFMNRRIGNKKWKK